MTITRLGLDVTVTPLLADQELPVTVRYWEGAVAVKGQRANQPIQGNGYLEMTGYADGGTRP
jgi:predicted secreted hydrolase